MHTAYGFSQSAGAAASLARAKANIGKHGAISIGGVHQVGDEMYEAFCLVCDDLEDGSANRQSGFPQDESLMVSMHPELFDRHPELRFRYPEIFRQTHPNMGYDNSMIH